MMRYEREAHDISFAASDVCVCCRAYRAESTVDCWREILVRVRSLSERIGTKAGSYRVGNQPAGSGLCLCGHRNRDQ